MCLSYFLFTYKNKRSLISSDNTMKVINLDLPKEYKYKSDNHIITRILIHVYHTDVERLSDKQSFYTQN